MSAIPASERLTDEQRAEVLRLWLTGKYGTPSLAAQFRTSAGTVERIVRGHARPPRQRLRWGDIG